MGNILCSVHYNKCLLDLSEEVEKQNIMYFFPPPHSTFTFMDFSSSTCEATFPFNISL